MDEHTEAAAALHAAASKALNVEVRITLPVCSACRRGATQSPAWRIRVTSALPGDGETDAETRARSDGVYGMRSTQVVLI